MESSHTDIPAWLRESEHYQPARDRDGFIRRNLLSLSQMLAQFRLDDGKPSAISPTVTVKLVFAVTCILLTSLARNQLFVLAVLAGMLVRLCLLPHRALVRVVQGAGMAALLSLVITAPAALMGQPQAALRMAAKALACVGITLMVAQTTPPAQLTHALRTAHVPGVAILTVDIAFRSIVQLGKTAVEVLTALKLRSVGVNRAKRAAMGGVGGVVLLKASRSAQDTLDAMRCRGFDGEYRIGAAGTPLAAVDAFWLCLLAALLVLFLVLQRAV